MSEDFLSQLRRVNAERWLAWAGSETVDSLYVSNEFGGEAGEVMNVVKKLEREARGWVGSRSSAERLAEEIADCIICLDSLARGFDIDLASAVATKFNTTSNANGFPHKLRAPEREQDGAGASAGFLYATEREQLRHEIINSPETGDFMAAVPLEAAHQRDRWCADHDAGKTAFDWFWLIGYLGQKAASSAVAGDTEKAMHHTISTAAALANWHAALSGADTSMRPGIDPVGALT